MEKSRQKVIAFGCALFVRRNLNVTRRTDNSLDGAALLAWLQEQARAEGCEYLWLDSAVHRAGAHRFYFRHCLSIIGYHFRFAPLQRVP